MPSAAEIFARTVIALEPYAADVVFVGGWVHALYLADANADERPVVTDDIDLSIPHRLLAGDRPLLLELVEAAGFTAQELGAESGLYEIFQPESGGAEVDLDLFTVAAHAREVVHIEGQGRLSAQGYPDQRILLDNSQWIGVGPEIHPLLDPPRRVRVPRLGAYALVKGLSSMSRHTPAKRAKDLVYLFEVVRHPRLGGAIIGEMPALAARYPAEYSIWRAYLERVLEDRQILADVSTQLLEGGRAEGPTEELTRRTVARFRRLLGETSDAG